MTTPLEGVLVVSVEQAIAAPFASRQLADLGARVLKIERPDSGDFARDYDSAVAGTSAFFVWANRGKDSFVLDLKDDDDRAMFDQLVAGADVFIQNLAPGAAERAGLLPHQVRERHPSIVACGISGYGLDGPRTHDKAYDLAIQAEAGAITLTGSTDEPSKVGFSVADIASGMYALSSILAALFRRQQTGEGATIELSMLECLAEWTAAPTYSAVSRGVTPARAGHRHAMISPYGVYSLADGRDILIAVQNQTEWQALCTDVFMQPGLADDERFATNQARIDNIDEFEPVLRAALASAPTEEMLARLAAARIAHSSVNDPITLWNHEQFRARDRFVDTTLPTGGTKTYKPPFNIDDAGAAKPVVPALGEHDPELVEELLRRSR
ncbi:MAG: CaiB/BaiF CoA-transferase family protein [Acidimicrobiales bacterium]|nr:CaiB/BaiF CoA-transferase family protein [Acidimicrobiales bacterium]MDG2217626.1 CaiB/BaiF CoA-transferase family protein [Acidimicrobiales bacterium]